MTLDSPIFHYARFRNTSTNPFLVRMSFLGIFIGLACALYHILVIASEHSSYIPFTLQGSSLFTGIALISTTLGIAGLQFTAFLNHKDLIMQRKQNSEVPPLTLEAARFLLRANHHGKYSFTQKLMRTLSASPHIHEFFTRLGIRARYLSLPNERSDDNAEYSSLLSKALEVSQMHGHLCICGSDLAVACFLVNPLLTRWYQQHDLTEADMTRLSQWIENRKDETLHKRRFWSLENLANHPPIGLHWIYGFTRVLSSSAEELTEWSRLLKAHRIVGRKTEIEQVESALSKGKGANVLLVGPVGVGKKTVIEGCAERIRRGISPLLGERIFEISGETFSELSERDAFTLAREAVRAGNIILAIPDIHLVGSDEESPQFKLLQQLSSSNRVRIIGTADPHHYHEALERNAELLRYFTKIEIKEPSEEETRAILEDAIPDFESRHGIFFTFSGLESLIADADKYLPNKPFPEKTMDMLESVGSWARSRKISFITSEIINQIFGEMFHVPANVASGSERMALLDLERLMHERVVGQDAAVTAIARSLQRIRSGIERKNKPIGSFLFLGPTGVGKTETAKTLANAYFGSESQMLRFDMSEYQTGEGVDRFVGSVQTNSPGLFASKVRDNPFSVILLDEIEKAYHDLLNLFLQILDEGFLTDAFGDKVSFTQSIIIATSNAGSEFIRELYSHHNVQNNIVPELVEGSRSDGRLGDAPGLPQRNNPSTSLPLRSGNNVRLHSLERQSEIIIEHILKQQLFSPELINRFDSVIVFHPLTRTDLTQIAQLQIKSLVEQLKNKGYLLEPNQELLETIVEIGYDPQFGARPMARAIQNTVETLIAQKILSGAIQKGVPFTVSSEEITQLSS